MTEPDFVRINGIVNFMRSATSAIDINQVMIKSGLNSFDQFTETQLTYLLIKAGQETTYLKELFFALNQLSTDDIRLLNSDNSVFYRWALTLGGLYFAKSIRRMIKKSDILMITAFLGAELYEHIFDFAQSKSCQEDFQLNDDHEALISGIGYKMINLYYKNKSKILTHYLFLRISFVYDNNKLSHLRFTDAYANDLLNRSKNFIFSQTE